MNKILKKLLSISLILVSVLGATSSAFAERLCFESGATRKQKAMIVFMEREFLDINSANIISEAIQYNGFEENKQEYSLALGIHEWIMRKNTKGANKLLYMIIRDNISLPVDDIYILIDLANQERHFLIKVSSRNALALSGYRSVKEFLTREVLVD